MWPHHRSNMEAKVSFQKKTKKGHVFSSENRYRPFVLWRKKVWDGGRSSGKYNKRKRAEKVTRLSRQLDVCSKWKTSDLDGLLFTSVAKPPHFILFFQPRTSLNLARIINSAQIETNRPFVNSTNKGLVARAEKVSVKKRLTKFPFDTSAFLVRIQKCPCHKTF